MMLIETIARRNKPVDPTASMMRFHTPAFRQRTKRL
jgi:hypothetical protein